MNAALNNLGVPSPIPGQTVSQFPDAASLRDWLIGLPHLQPLDAARSIYDALFTLNRSKLDRDTRQAHAELFQTHIDMRLPALELLLGRSASNDKNRDKVQQAWDFTSGLLLELAISYKLILIEESQRKLSFGSAKLMAQWAGKVLAVFERLLVLTYGTYHTEPNGLWRDTHLLFRFALHNKWMDIEEVESGPFGIQRRYKQMLLLSLADPYALLPGEIERVQDWLGKLAAHAQFLSLSHLPDPAGYFLIRLDRDSPPQFYGHRQTDADSSQALLFNTVDVVRRLHKEQQAMDKINTSSTRFSRATQQLDLVRRLVRCWGITPQRVFNRIPNHSPLAVVCGLYETHRLLLQRRFAKTDVEHISLEDDQAFEIDNPAAVDHPWRVINVSPGGYALSAEHAEPGMINVGMVVGLSSDTAPLTNIGVIRWVRKSAERIEIGVQLLAPSAEPVYLRSGTAHSDAGFESALLLAAVPEQNQPESLIAPGNTFMPLKALTLRKVTTEEWEIRAIRQMDQGMTADQFEFLAPADFVSVHPSL